MERQQPSLATAPNEPSAFDAWLKQNLRELYGDLLREPVPDTLTALLPA